MSSRTPLASNFVQLQEHDEQLLRIGMLAERYFAEDPNTCLLKLRQLAEVLAQTTATYVGQYIKPEESQYELLSRLRDQGILPREVHQLFGELRRTGNEANHTFSGDHRVALSMLKIAWQLGVWFHRTFKDPKFQSGPFIPPKAPKNESDELQIELATLSQTLATHQAANQEQAEQLTALVEQLRTAKDEQAFWEQLAAEVEAEKVELGQRLAAKQSEAATQPAAEVAAFVSAANTAAANVQIDEAGTRRLIDNQLRQAGWIVNSEVLRYSKGTRPEKGKNMAIAEWPTATGPADYVLFVGLAPLAAVEAKRKNLNVSSALQQSKRYSRDFTPSSETL
ncbi:MAG: type I restriction endonuclease, partial [Verrucomicrobiota bacterium]